MLDLINELNKNGVKWEYVYNETKKQLFIKYDDKLIPWYF